MLVNLGIWPEIKGWQELQTMPRYFPGRDILVKATVEPSHDSQNYMRYDSKQEKYCTHNAKLIGRDGTNFIAEVEGCPEPLSVPVAETLLLN